MRKRLFISLLIALVFVNFISVYAQEDFTVVSQNLIDLCPCSNQAYGIVLQNIGSSTSSYKITNSGSAAAWVKPSPGSISLNAGASANILIYVNSPCNLYGAYDILTYITTEKGLTKAIKQKLNLMSCYDYNISHGQLLEPEEVKKSIIFSGHQGSYEVCKDSAKILPILVQNNEDFGNSYEVNLEGNDWAKLNVNEFSLKAKEKGIVLISLEPPKDSAGNYKLNLNAITNLGKLKKSSIIDINIAKCYSLSLEIEKEKDTLCGKDEKAYNINVKNNGRYEEVINLSLEGADFVFFENKTQFTLKSKEEENINLIAKPSNESGTFNVKAKASIKNNPKIYTIDNIIFDVIKANDCYKANVIFDNLLRNKYTEEYYPVRIINNGKREVAYKISIEGPDWISISPEELNLSTGQSGNVNLHLNPSENINEGIYGVAIKAEAKGEVYSKNVDINLKKENLIIKKLKAAVKFYQYYIYLLIVFLIILFIFRNPIKKVYNTAKESYRKYKIKRQRLRALRKARRVRAEQSRKRKEEEKKKREEERKAEEERKKAEEEKRKKEELKKIEEKKKAEKKAKEKGRKVSFGLKIFFIILVIIILLAISWFLLYYYKIVDASLLGKIKSIALKIIYSSYSYLYYLLIGIAIVAVFAFIYNKVSKKEKVAEEKEIKKVQEEKKAEKAKKEKKKKRKAWPRFFKSFYAVILILIFVAAAILFIIYGKKPVDYVKDFITLYLYYIIAGIIILIIIILLIRFYKPIVDFLLEEDKEK